MKNSGKSAAALARASKIVSGHRLLMSGTALTAFVATGLFSPLSVQQAQAINECNTVGSGVVTIDCGSGPYNSGVIYGNTQTSTATSVIFNFDNSKVTGPGSGDRSAVQLSTNKSGQSLDINIDQVGAGAAPIFTGKNIAFSIGAETSNGFRASTSSTDAGITFDVNQEFDGKGVNGTGASFTGGNITAASGTSMGVSLATSGGNSGITVNLANVTVQGGTVNALAGTAHGFGVATKGDNSAVGFSLDGGTINAGSVNALSGVANGVNISTTGANSDVAFDLKKGSITGGTGLSSGHGVNISTTKADSDVTFDSAQNTSITATNGDGVHIETNGGDILANGTIDGKVESKLEILGVGVGTGFTAIAGNGGDALVHVGTTGEVIGTGAGIVATTNGAGNIDIDIDGKVSQNKASALPLTFLLPVGVGGVASGTGNVDIASTKGSTVSQIGSTAISPTKGVGMLGLNTGSGTSTVSAGGAVSATGIGIAAITTSNTATANVSGDITVGGGKGVSPLGLLTMGTFDYTVGALAASASGDASVNIHGGSINGLSIVNGTPDIGGLALVLGGTKDATVDIGDGKAPASVVNGNEFGIIAANIGSGDAIVDSSQTAPDGTDGDLDPDRNVINSGGTGVLAIALGGGDAKVNTDNSTVNADDTGIIAGGVNATVDAGEIVAANGSGVFAVAIGGETKVNAHEVIAANGFAGIGAFATGNVTVNLNPDDLDYDPDTDAANVRNAKVGGYGVMAIGGGAVSVQGTNSFVASDDSGIVAAGATIDIDSGLVRSENGSGILAAALGGVGEITLHNDVIANGLAGVGGFATGNLSVDTQGNNVNNVGGIGIGAVSLATATVDSQDGLVSSEDTGILVFGENAIVDSGAVSSANGSGVLATAFGGDATVTTHGLIQADNGLFGASAVSFGGEAHVTVGANIDPPSIGANAVTIGSKNATVDVLDGVLVEADLIGVNVANFGTGNVYANIGEDDADATGASIQSAGVGIAATKLFGEGGIEINVSTNSSVLGNDSGIVILAATIGSTDNSAVVNNSGSIQSSSLLPVIASATDGDLTINNKAGGLIQNTSGNWAAIAVASAAGGSNTIVNNGTITGAVELYGDDGNTFTNNSGNTWNFSGINTFTTGGDNLFDNTVNGVANAKNSATFFISGGDSTINNAGLVVNQGINAYNFATQGDSKVDNSGTWRVNGRTYIADLGDIDFNNSNLLDMQDNAVDDYMEITSAFGSADFNASGNSTFGFDAQLTPGGDADFLFVDGDVSGSTYVSVNDVDFLLPGQYDPNGVQFAQVGGYSDAGDFYTNGGIDKGLFRYDAYLLPDTASDSGDNEWYLASVLDREAYEFPVIASGADALWNQSTGTWLDRTADLRSAFGETGSGIVDLKNEGAVAATPGNVTPGFWLKAFGGTSQRDFSNVSAPLPNLIGPSYQFDDTYNQNFYGFMAGVDFGKESVTANGANEAWIFGLLGGYAGSNLDFDNSATEADYSAGSVGAYLTYLNGGLFIDATIKADFGTIDYSTHAGGGYSDSTSADYTSVGGVLDAGYRFNMASGWFIEPKATLSYVSTDIDDITVLGTGVAFNDGDSFRGRLGARVGTSIINGGNLIEPYLEASVWNEFDGDYQAALFSNNFEVPVSHDVSGVYGEVTAGASVINVGNGWSGFAKGAVQFGDDSYLGFSGNLGLRKAF